MAAEIETRLNPGPVVLGHREARFSTDTLPSLPALRLATADDLFLLVGEGEGIDRTRASLETIGAIAHGLPWAATLARLASLRAAAGWTAFGVSASALGRRNYSRYEIEDRTAAGAAAALGLPYRPTRAPLRDDGTELSIRVHLSGTRATFMLRVFDTPLHRRPYKQRSCVGTLHPPLAAAMAMVAGVRRGMRLLDPFAGVGTVAIEAQLLQPRAGTFAAEIDETRLRGALANARSAGVAVGLVRADAALCPWRDGTFDRVVTNVPWERAVAAAGRLAHAPLARDRELARVLGSAGRAVLLVHPDDPLGRDRPGRSPLALLHRSWVSVSGQHPRLCILASEGAVAGGAIDAAAPWGPALLRQIHRADTAEALSGDVRPVAHGTPTHPPWLYAHQPPRQRAGAAGGSRERSVDPSRPWLCSLSPGSGSEGVAKPRLLPTEARCHPEGAHARNSPDFKTLRATEGSLSGRARASLREPFQVP